MVGTSPAAGTQAKQGSEVTLQISSGDNGQPPGAQRAHPGAERRPSSCSRAAGFTRVNTRTQQVVQPQFDGRVIEQSPAGGQNADTGDQVQLVIGQASDGGGN